MFSLYHLIRIETGHRYVGLTSRPHMQRWLEHLYSLRKGKHHNRYLQTAWDKYGEEAFKFEIIQQFPTLVELNVAEAALIKTGTDLYNLAVGGGAHFQTNKVKLAIGAANKKAVVGMNVKTGLIQHFDSAVDAGRELGHDHACIRKCALNYLVKRDKGETSRCMSHFGWVWMEKCDFSIEKINEKAQLASTSKVRYERAVMGINMLNSSIVEYRSACEAGRNGFNHRTVYGCCVNRIRAHRDHIWIYADSVNPQSLLKKKLSEYLANPPRTGPKKCQ